MTVEGRRYVVGTGQGADFVTLGAAMEVVDSGDVLTLQPGLYEELVKITADITIVAAAVDNQAGVNADVESDVETTITNGVIIAANATLQNLQVRGRVDVRKGHAVIEGCDVHHGSDGIRVGAQCKLTLKSCRVHHCSAGGDGVYFAPESAGEVEDVDIYECRVNGVHVNAASVVCRNNRVRDCAFGFYYCGAATGLVQGNSVEHVSRFGIYVIGGSDPVVRTNTVRECGILCAFVSQGGKGLWTDNTFDGSMHVLADNDAKLSDNHVTGKLDIEPRTSLPVA